MALAVISIILLFQRVLQLIGAIAESEANSVSDRFIITNRLL